MDLNARAQIISAPALLINAPAQLNTAPAQPLGTVLSCIRPCCYYFCLRKNEFLSLFHFVMFSLERHVDFFFLKSVGDQVMMQDLEGTEG